MVNFPFPIDTTSLRVLALAPLFWPKNGLRMVAEPAVAADSADAIWTVDLGAELDVLFLSGGSLP